MNKCKDCGSDLIENGVHPESPDYRRWKCLNCDDLISQIAVKRIEVSDD